MSWVQVVGTLGPYHKSRQGYLGSWTRATVFITDSIRNGIELGFFFVGYDGPLNVLWAGYKTTFFKLNLISLEKHRGRGGSPSP